MERKDSNQSERAAGGGIVVNVPPEHQGVANALRTAFLPAQNNLPHDFNELLAQLR
jgi:hypothetical protein